jgi:FTR1 family protein
MGATFVITLREAFGVVVIFTAVGLLTWHAWWMQPHARAIRGQVQQRIDEARAARRLWLVGLIAFTGVFREGAETVLFLWGAMTQVSSTSGWAIFYGGKHLSLSRFFSATTVFRCCWPPGSSAPASGGFRGSGSCPWAPRSGTPRSSCALRARSAAS